MVRLMHNTAYNIVWAGVNIIFGGMKKKGKKIFKNLFELNVNCITQQLVI